jgi:hypothetical protein
LTDSNDAHSEVRSKNIFLALTEMADPFFNAGGLGVKFDGIGAVLDAGNKHVFPILRGQETTVSAKDDQFSLV